MGILTGIMFLKGAYIWGAIFYQICFMFDAMDGVVARLKHLSSPLGGLFDISVDLLVRFWIASALLFYSLYINPIPTCEQRLFLSLE